jgi:hypothetical protein
MLSAPHGLSGSTPGDITLINEVTLDQVSIIILILLHSHLSPPHEACQSPDQVAYCHILNLVSLEPHLEPALGWSQGQDRKVLSR